MRALPIQVPFIQCLFRPFYCCSNCRTSGPVECECEAVGCQAGNGLLQGLLHTQELLEDRGSEKQRSRCNLPLQVCWGTKALPYCSVVGYCPLPLLLTHPFVVIRHVNGTKK